MSNSMTDRLGLLFDLLDRFVAEGQVDGAGVAVARGGEQLAEYQAGMAAPDRPATADTLWPLASASKLYTAAAVMALVERGLLTLGTTVRGVWPDFDGDGRERVTLRHLLTHTSGLIYESPAMAERLMAQTPLDDLIDEALEYPLLFPPGTRLSYSDYGIAIAGRMAAIVAGRPFPDLVRTLVLEPAGLTGTFMPPPAAEYGRIAHVVGPLAEGTDGAMYNSPYARELAHPAFGAVATAGDLLRFGLLFRPSAPRGILSAATIQAMTTDQTGGGVAGSLIGAFEIDPYPWGLGFSVKGTSSIWGDLLSPAAFGHGGASGCILQVDPVHDIAVAFVSNRHLNTGLDAWVTRLATVVNVAAAALT